MNMIVEAANASSRFEKCNTALKRKYLKKNVDLINFILEQIPGYCGSFGTGYPFYILDKNFEGELPLINEQLRYNKELIDESREEKCWICEECLKTTGLLMPDLKQYCKPCPQIKDSLKPRKVINRLPDVDMWMICSDESVEQTKEIILKVFDSYDMHTSDIDPTKTIKDFSDIVTDLENNVMPNKMLPLDIHIIKYSELSKLLSDIPFSLLEAYRNNKIPYLPIHPLSLRKTWQYDDEAYNFALDYLLSLTPFKWKNELSLKYNISKQFIIESFNNDSLKYILDQVSPDSVKRRMKTKQLQKKFESRIDSWRK